MASAIERLEVLVLPRLQLALGLGHPQIAWRQRREIIGIAMQDTTAREQETGRGARGRGEDGCRIRKGSKFG